MSTRIKPERHGRNLFGHEQSQIGTCICWFVGLQEGDEETVTLAFARIICSLSF